ncbi:MAG: endonuclease/exonuclease/phosphatase family protein [Candidatus Curtissbacteria bacterium]|nr:endonuclease/exonuclease/phosphatase family protein [Candidatus Curtissbacteria bacterium]
MTLKFIQANIFMGKYLDSLIDFIKDEDPDIVTMQEVTACDFNLYEDKSAHIFDVIGEKTGLEGVFDPVMELAGKPDAEFGNAVFSKYEVTKHKVLVLKEFRPVTWEELEATEGRPGINPQVEKHAVDAIVDVGGTKIHVVSWHGAWVSHAEDSPESIRQAQIVADYLETLEDPFIVAGDLNVGPQTETIGLINKVANNLMMNSGVRQTTHPTVHKIAPRGYLIDYIFTSSHFKVKSLKVPEIIVSDHLPVVAELQI